MGQVPSMKRLEELPDLPPPTPFLLALLMITWWLHLRIGILRRQALRGPDEPPVRTWGWLRWLSEQPWIGKALATVALLLVAAIVASFFVRW